MKNTQWKEINIIGHYSCGCCRNNWKKLEVFITERSSNYGWGLNGIPFVLNLELILIVHLFADLFIRCHSRDMNNVLMCSLTFLLRSTSVSSNLCIDVSVGIWPVIVSCYYCDLFECIQTPLGVSASFLFSFRCTYHWMNNVYIVLYMNSVYIILFFFLF